MKKKFLRLIAGAMAAVSIITLASCGDSEPTATKTVETGSKDKQSVVVILVKSEPTKTKYVIGDSLETSGLVIEKVLSDGSRVDLLPSEYTIDYTKFDNSNSGTYEIPVILNSDKTKKTSFTVSVSKVTAIRLADSSRKVFVANEEYIYKDFFTFEVSFEDGSKRIIDSSSEIYKSIEFSHQGYQPAGTLNVSFSYGGVEGHDTITVKNMADLSVRSLRVQFNGLTTGGDAYVLANYAKNYTGGYVKFVETGDKEFWVSLDVDASKLQSATAPGVYPVSFGYNGTYQTINFTLIDLTGYTMTGLSVDNVDDVYSKTLFVGEKMTESVYKKFSFNAIYHKDGVEDIKVPMLSNEVRVDCDTKAIGKTTALFYLYSNADINCTLDIDVLRLPEFENNKVYYSYEEANIFGMPFTIAFPDFKVEDGKYMFYSESKEDYFVGTFEGINRGYTTEGKEIVHLIYDKGTISLNPDGSVRKDSLGEGEFVLSYNIAGHTMWFATENKKVPTALYEVFITNGEPHIGNAEGEKITLDTVFTENANVVTVFVPKSGAGQPWLGEYVGSTTYMFGEKVVLNADGILFYFSASDSEPYLTLEYNYREDGELVLFNTSYMVTMIIDKDGNLTISGNDTSCKYTKN